MRRWFGRVTVVAGLSALMSCSMSTSNPSPTPASPTEHRSLQGDRGFALTYPGNWTAKTLEDGLVAAVVTSPSQGSDDAFSENVNVVIEPAGGGFSVAQYAEANLQSISNFQDFKLIEQADLNVGPLAAKTVEYTARLNDRDLHLWQVMMVTPDAGFVLTYTADPGAFDAFRGEAEDIVASFRVS